MGWGWPPQWAGMLNQAAAPVLRNLRVGKTGRGSGLPLSSSMISTVL